MERGSGSGGSGRRHVFFGAATVLLVITLAACSVASLSPSPGASASSSVETPSPSAPALSTPDLSTPSATPTATATPTPTSTSTVAASPTPTDTAYEEPTDSPTPPLPKGPLPSVGPAPAGNWTGVKWIDVPVGHSPTLPAIKGDEDGSGAFIEGWSKGYVEFVWDAHKRTITPWDSTDGLRWRQGTRLDLSAWTPYFKSYDAADDGSDPLYHDNCFFEVGGFQEGPATLLLEGRFQCPGTADCDLGEDGPATGWTSSDGLSWTPAKLPYGDNLDDISGGSSGFIGLDDSTSKPTIWVSSDGQTWRRGVLPAEAETAGSSVGYPVSFSGGYVIPGVVRMKSGHRTGDGGCGGMTDMSEYQGALWWSPDGINWTRDSLSGASPTYDVVFMNVAQIDDHTLVAEQAISGDETEWVSGDGKTWTRLKGNPIEIITSTLSGLSGPLEGYSGTLVGRDRCVFWADSSLGRDFSVFDAHFNLITLTQIGDVPSLNWWQMALGPTGLLVTADGSRFWLGIPTTG
jgi:hypothetical protein